MSSSIRQHTMTNHQSSMAIRKKMYHIMLFRTKQTKCFFCICYVKYHMFLCFYVFGKGKTGECLYIELFTWKMPHLYLFLCKKKAKALRFGICHSLPFGNAPIASPNKKIYHTNPKNWQVKNIAHTQNRQHNTQKQDEPLPPYPQRLCLISPLQHLPWPQIMVPLLPMSLLQAPGCRFALAAAGSLGWDAELRCINK